MDVRYNNTKKSKVFKQSWPIGMLTFEEFIAREDDK
jgi:hypothetical protein